MHVPAAPHRAAPALPIFTGNYRYLQEARHSNWHPCLQEIKNSPLLTTWLMGVEAGGGWLNMLLSAAKEGVLELCGNEDCCTGGKSPPP